MQINVIWIFIIVIIIITTTILYPILFPDHKISNISLDKTDLNHNVNRDSLNIYYNIENNGDFTLSPKIEIKLNETCFEKIHDDDFDDLPPNQKLRTYTQVYLKWNTEEECIGKSYDIFIILKDVNGKILDSKKVSIGIV